MIVLDGHIYRDSSSLITKIHLSRTKMEEIARNVLAPKLLEMVTRKLEERNIPLSIACNKDNRKCLLFLFVYLSTMEAFKTVCYIFMKKLMEAQNRLQFCIKYTATTTAHIGLTSVNATTYYTMQRNVLIIY